MAIAATITEVTITSAVTLAPTNVDIAENSLMSPEPICLPHKYSNDKTNIGQAAFITK